MGTIILVVISFWKSGLVDSVLSRAWYCVVNLLCAGWDGGAIMPHPNTPTPMQLYIPAHINLCVCVIKFTVYKNCLQAHAHTNTHTHARSIYREAAKCRSYANRHIQHESKPTPAPATQFPSTSLRDGPHPPVPAPSIFITRETNVWPTSWAR